MGAVAQIKSIAAIGNDLFDLLHTEFNTLRIGVREHSMEKLFPVF